MEKKQHFLDLPDVLAIHPQYPLPPPTTLLTLHTA
jgi:hypothetical protein